MSNHWEPSILGICCNWCAYAGADMAGVSRMQYPPNVEIIRVMCSGRIDPAFILRAFRLGADGVLVAGCHEADCHYISGNQSARRRVEALAGVLDTLGLGRDRLRLRWISANEGALFAEGIRDFVDTLRALGPSPIETPKLTKGVRTRTQGGDVFAGGSSTRNLSRGELHEGGGSPLRESELASESDPFVNHVDFQALVAETGVLNCLECGKCTASCPVARRDETFSPRRTIEKALEDLAEDIETDRLLWSCLTCRTCEQRCPSGVSYSEFVRGARAGAKRLGQKGRTSHSGANHDLMRIQSAPKLKPDRMAAYESLKVKEKAGKDDWLYFAGCAPYYQALYSELPVQVGNIPRDSVALLNKAGIIPVVMAAERCCGHDLLWNGDVEDFAALAKVSAEAIKATGARKIVTSCPECYRTLAVDFKEHAGLDLEVKHISEVLAANAEALGLSGTREVVTVQDACRLGRQMGVYDPPRELLAAAGAQVEEMAHTRGDALCCGVSAWVSCGQCSKSMQVARLKEAAATGASTLVTPCLKCSIHLTCASSGELPVPRSEVDVKIMDLTAYLAKAAGLAGAKEPEPVMAAASDKGDA